MRYADDWIIGIAGPASFAKKLKEKIAQFLKERLLLELSQEKTLITNAKRKARFLGVEIQRISSVKGEIKRFTNKKGHAQRIPTTMLRLNAPIQDIIKKLMSKGLAQ